MTAEERTGLWLHSLQSMPVMYALLEELSALSSIERAKHSAFQSSRSSSQAPAGRGPPGQMPWCQSSAASGCPRLWPPVRRIRWQHRPGHDDVCKTRSHRFLKLWDGCTCAWTERGKKGRSTFQAPQAGMQARASSAGRHHHTTRQQCSFYMLLP
eukprot:1142139-Pelagomonas_calceolata.AAC.5